MSSFSSTAQRVYYKPKPSFLNKYPEREWIKNHFSYAFSQMQVGDYMGILYFAYHDSRNDVDHYSDPVIVKVVEKRNVFRYSVKVQMANGKVIDLFSNEKSINEYEYPYLNEEFLKIVHYEGNPRYSSPSEVEISDRRELKDYIINFFETNVSLKEAMEKYKNRFVTEEDRQKARKLMEEEELEKRRQAEQRQHEINKQREQERQAGAEIDDLFNSMRK